MRRLFLVFIGVLFFNCGFASSGEGWQIIGEELVAKYTSLRAKAIETGDTKDIKAYGDFQHSLIDLSERVGLLLDRKSGIQSIDGEVDVSFSKVLSVRGFGIETDVVNFRKEIEDKGDRS